MQITSCCLIGIFLALRKPLGSTLSHIRSYRNSFRLLLIKSVVNGCAENNAIHPLSLMILSYSSHNSTKGRIVSHLFRVVPYGRSSRYHLLNIQFCSFGISGRTALYLLYANLILSLVEVLLKFNTCQTNKNQNDS